MMIFALTFLLAHLNYSEEPCTICGDSLIKENERTEATKCKHEFHSECLNKWIFEQNAKCPTCGADLNCMRTAALQGDNDKISRLIAEGTDVDETDEISYGYTPLYFAIWGNHFSTVQLLLEKGADVNVQDHIYGMSPLHLAVKEGRESIVKILAEMNPKNINAEDNHGDTALMFGAAIGNAKIVEILLVKGADTSQRNSKGKTAFELTKNEECMLLLRIVLTADKDENTPLHLAVLRGCKSSVKMLIARNPKNVNCPDKSGQTPLILAAKIKCTDEPNRYTDIVQMLVENGARVNHADHVYGFAAIHWATLEGNESIVHILITKKANINAQTLFRKESPLMIAAANGRVKIVEMLLENGASRIIRNYRGRTALDLTQDHKCVMLLTAPLKF